MNKKNKTIVVTTLLVMALFQSFFFYYFTTGFEEMLLLMPFGLIGLILTIIAFIKIVKYRSTNTLYHLICLPVAFLVGLLTIRPDIIEYIDFKARMQERIKIVAEVKKGILKPDSNGICHLYRNSFLPISNGGDDIWIKEDSNGIISIDFFIDRGFIDHYSAFLYTNDAIEVRDLNDVASRYHGIRKIDNNWYLVAY